MTQFEKVKQLFEEIKKGNYHANVEFFEVVTVNSTRMAHTPGADEFLREVEDWANAHAAEHPGFLARADLSIGFIYFLADNFEKAAKYLHRSHELYSASKDEEGLGACSVAIGFLHRSKGEIDLALKYGLQGLAQLASTQRFQMIRLVGCYWVGSVYADTGHLEEAVRLFKEGLAMDYPPGIVSLGPRITNGIAGVYMKQKNYALALEHYEKSLAGFNETTESTFKSRALTDLGDYYTKMGNYDEAISYNQQALALRQETKVLNASITNLMNLGDLYNRQGKFNDAIEVLKQALKLAEEIGVKVKMHQIHQLLSDIYLGMGKTSESLAHYKAFHEIREDVNHEDMDRKVKNQVELFKAQQTQKENAIIKAQKIEIEKKNIELQETIDELTLARISKRARAITLTIGIVLFIFQDRILEHILHIFASDNYLLSVCIKVAIVFSLEPLNKTIEHYLLRRVIKKQKREVVV